jgi:hypothetical protein
MKIIAITFIVALILGLGAKLVGGWPAGYTMLGVLVGLPLLGLIITLDDEFDNPNPFWKSWEAWVELGVRASLSGVGFAIDLGWFTWEAVAAWVIAATGAAAGVALLQRPVELRP